MFLFDYKMTQLNSKKTYKSVIRSATKNVFTVCWHTSAEFIWCNFFLNRALGIGAKDYYQYEKKRRKKPITRNVSKNCIVMLFCTHFHPPLSHTHIHAQTLSLSYTHNHTHFLSLFPTHTLSSSHTHTHCHTHTNTHAHAHKL